MIAADLSRQESFDADPRATQQINFAANLDRAETQQSISFWKNQKKLNLISHKAL